jgi:hypothetical protein
MEKSHDVSDSFWTIADERVPRSGKHYSTLTNGHALAIVLYTQ